MKSGFWWKWILIQRHQINTSTFHTARTLGAPFFSITDRVNGPLNPRGIELDERCLLLVAAALKYKAKRRIHTKYNANKTQCRSKHNQINGYVIFEQVGPNCLSKRPRTSDRTSEEDYCDKRFGKLSHQASPSLSKNETSPIWKRTNILS